jgi:CDP-6-deoxy-D-xylo-4-hexulose-3-dehydrase
VNELKNTDEVMTDTFWIGVYPGMTTEIMEFILESFKDFMRL